MKNNFKRSFFCLFSFFEHFSAKENTKRSILFCIILLTPCLRVVLPNLFSSIKKDDANKLVKVKIIGYVNNGGIYMTHGIIDKKKALKMAHSKKQRKEKTDDCHNEKEKLCKMSFAANVFYVDRF